MGIRKNKKCKAPDEGAFALLCINCKNAGYLVENLYGYYSGRINLQHRLGYQIYNEETAVDGKKYEGTVEVVRMLSHYDT